jgi:hypothetical protein
MPPDVWAVLLCMTRKWLRLNFRYQAFTLAEKIVRSCQPLDSYQAAPRHSFGEVALGEFWEMYLAWSFSSMRLSSF